MKKSLLALAVACVSVHLVAEDAPPSSPLDAALPIIEKEYLKRLDRAALEEKALRSMLKELDPYSGYLSAAEWTAFHADFVGSFGGVEAGIAPDPGMEVVVPAEELEAWRNEMERFDAPRILTAEEQRPTVPDRVLTRALAVLEDILSRPKNAK